MPSTAPRSFASAGAALALTASIALGWLTGCASAPQAPPTAIPGATYTGPAPLRGTIGSLARLSGGEPLLVSGYGVVVNLDGTGSDVVPENVRGWIRDEMRKNGIGSARLAQRNPDYLRLRPDTLLRDLRTAVVRVRGLIPPGASPGTTFDLYVTALDRDTRTTSLSGGTLWTTRLAVLGDNPQLAYMEPLASGRGPVFTHPDDPEVERVAASTADPFAAPTEADKARFRRAAVVANGGVTTEARRLELVLHQASFGRVRDVAGVINERFRSGPDDREPTASGVSDQVIRLHVPARFQDDPARLVELIAHTFPYPEDPVRVTQEMCDWIAETTGTPEAQRAQRSARLTLEALGATVVPSLRQRYQDPNGAIAAVVLEAGARLQDPKAADALATLAGSPDPDDRSGAAEALAFLPNSTVGLRALRKLLDDDDHDVRIAAYESLARTGSPLVERLAMTNLDGLKYYIDRVPAQRPLIYITNQGTPRLVLFGPRAGFAPPVFASVWNGRLMMQTPIQFEQALFKLEAGNEAYLPVAGRGPEPGTTLPTLGTLLDAAGRRLSVILESEESRQAFLTLPTADTSGETGASLSAPVAVARVRLLETPEPGRPPTTVLHSISPGLGSMPLSIFYRDHQAGGADVEPGGSLHRVTPTLATLAYFLGHAPTMEQPQEGLDLNFGEVVDALAQVSRTGGTPAAFELRLSPLAAAVAEAQQQGPARPTVRPDTAG